MSVSAPGVPTVSPPNSESPNFLVCGEAGREALQPRIVDAFGQRQVEQIAFRTGGHGGEVGEVAAQQPPGDQVGRTVRGEMDPFDHGVRGYGQHLSFGRVEQSGIVLKAARAGGSCKRRQEAADQLEFAGPAHAAGSGAGSSSSPGRALRAMRSNTAVANRACGSSKKSPTRSVYSRMATRGGTSCS